jgi:hypothetical protein
MFCKGHTQRRSMQQLSLRGNCRNSRLSILSFFLLRFQICCLQDSGNFPIASTIHREHQLTCQNFQTPDTKLDCYHGHLIRLHVTTSCTFSMHTRILAIQARRYLRWQEVVTSRTADLGLRYHLGIDLDKDYWLMRVGERR